MQVSLERPELFPASTQEQLSWEFFERRMDLLREEICHPLAGIYTDEDWAAFKEVYGPPCCLPETRVACACMQQKCTTACLLCWRSRLSVPSALTLIACSVSPGGTVFGALIRSGPCLCTSVEHTCVLSV